MFFPILWRHVAAFTLVCLFWQQSENFVSRVRIWRQLQHVVKCLSSIGLLGFFLSVVKGLSIIQSRAKISRKWSFITSEYKLKAVFYRIYDLVVGLRIEEGKTRV